MGDYIRIYYPNHHHAKNDGRVRKHRLVYELYNKCCILPWIFVHHINEMKDDNRPENLTLMTRTQHITYHNVRKMNDRKCSRCGTSITYKQKTKSMGLRPTWYTDKQTGLFLCDKCHHRQSYLNNREHLVKQARIYRQKKRMDMLGDDRN